MKSLCVVGGIVVYGLFVAVKNRNWKKQNVYSTIDNDTFKDTNFAQCDNFINQQLFQYFQDDYIPSKIVSVNDKISNIDETFVSNVDIDSSQLIIEEESDSEYDSDGDLFSQHYNAVIKDNNFPSMSKVFNPEEWINTACKEVHEYNFKLLTDKVIAKLSKTQIDNCDNLSKECKTRKVYIELNNDTFCIDEIYPDEEFTLHLFKHECKEHDIHRNCEECLKSEKKFNQNLISSYLKKNYPEISNCYVTKITVLKDVENCPSLTYNIMKNNLIRYLESLSAEINNNPETYYIIKIDIELY